MHFKLLSVSPIVSLFLIMCLIITLTKSTPVPSVVNQIIEENIRKCKEQVEICETNGIVPIAIINSIYRILSDNSICCPRTPDHCDGTPYCTSKVDMEEFCGEKGVVREPCSHCWTCAKLKGEICGGTQDMHGRCGSGHKCFIRGQMKIDYSGKDNSTGICISTGTCNYVDMQLLQVHIWLANSYTIS